LRSAVARAGHRYDASAFPSPAGLVARARYGRRYPRPRLRAADVWDAAAELAAGSRPRLVSVEGRELVEVPLTAMPYTRLPLHASHLLLVARRAPRLAARYLELALSACARTGIGPAFVIHPTDVLDAADAPALRGFPGMGIPAARKLGLVRHWLALAEARFRLVTVRDQAASVN
jgi:hypothetical protein